MANQSASSTAVMPKSTPLMSAAVAAAITAMETIVPLATGTQVNYGLLVATFLVTFFATILSSLYHLQLPSAIQQVAITEGAALITAAVAAHTHTAIAVPVPTPVAPASAAPVAAPAPVPAPPAPTVEVNVTPPAASPVNLPPAGTPPQSASPEPVATPA